jgi:hypothetical protein
VPFHADKMVSNCGLDKKFTAFCLGFSLSNKSVAAFAKVLFNKMVVPIKALFLINCLLFICVTI